MQTLRMKGTPRASGLSQRDLSSVPSLAYGLHTVPGEEPASAQPGASPCERETRVSTSPGHAAEGQHHPACTDLPLRVQRPEGCLSLPVTTFSASVAGPVSVTRALPGLWRVWGSGNTQPHGGTRGAQSGSCFPTACPPSFPSSSPPFSVQTGKGTGVKSTDRERMLTGRGALGIVLLAAAMRRPRSSVNLEADYLKTLNI